jgi:hypothetical protein
MSDLASLEDKVRAMEEELTQLRGFFDRAKATEEIRRILFGYPECIDKGDIDGLVKLFTGVKRPSRDGSGELRALTADEVREMYSSSNRYYEDGLPHTKHLITNVDIWFSNDNRTANARSYYVVLQSLKDFPLQIICTGRYEDEYEFDGTKWKLTVQTVHDCDLIGDMTHHVYPEIEGHMRDQMVRNGISLTV